MVAGPRDPALRLAPLPRLGQGDQVGVPLAPVEGKQPIGKDEGGVWRRSAVRRGAAALGLQLVAEIAREAAVEAEGKPSVGLAQALLLAGEVVEDRAAERFEPTVALDPKPPGAHLVCDGGAE